jgi:uncharacterized membrane protein YhaH (DUF805 family)
MNFTQAISSGFNNYVNFTGRAARSEFWYWTLFAILASIAGELVDLALFSSSTFTPVQDPRRSRSVPSGARGLGQTSA